MAQLFFNTQECKNFCGAKFCVFRDLNVSGKEIIYRKFEGMVKY